MLKFFKIQFLVSVWVFLLLSSGCFYTNNMNSIKGIKVFQTFPNVNEDGRLTKYDTFKTEIYYFKEKVLYMSSYKYSKIKSSKQDVKDINYAFIYSKGEKYGYLLDKWKSENWIMVRADSIIKEEWSSRIDLSSNLKKMELTETYKNGSVKSGKMEIGYNFKSIFDSTFNGTIIYSFAKKLEDLPYSLSPDLEMRYKLKLNKVFIRNNERILPNSTVKLDAIEQLFYIDTISISKNKKQQLMEYFNK